MEDGDLEPLGRDGREGGVGVAEYEESVGHDVLQEAVGFAYDVPQGLPQVLPCGVEVVVGGTEAEVLEEDLVQGVVPVLPRVDQEMVEVNVELLHDLAEPDDLRAGTHDGHDLQAAHGFSTSRT